MNSRILNLSLRGNWSNIHVSFCRKSNWRNVAHIVGWWHFWNLGLSNWHSFIVRSDILLSLNVEKWAGQWMFLSLFRQSNRPLDDAHGRWVGCGVKRSLALLHLLSQFLLYWLTSFLNHLLGCLLWDWQLLGFLQTCLHSRVVVILSYSLHRCRFHFFLRRCLKLPIEIHDLVKCIFWVVMFFNEDFDFYIFV